MKKRHNPNPARRHEWHAPDGQVYELKDAPAGMTVYIPPPGAEACAKALPLDPNHCAAAEQWMMTAGVPVVQIGRDKCYIPIRENGQMVVYRMRLKFQKDKARLDHFDSTNEWPDDEGLTLYGIPSSQTLDSRRSESKRLRERWHTIGHKPIKKATRVNLRDASRRAQVTITK